MRYKSTIYKKSVYLFLLIFQAIMICSCTKSTDDSSDSSKTEGVVTDIPDQVSVIPSTPTPKITATDSPSSVNATPTITVADAATEQQDITLTPAPASISIKYIGNSYFYITFPDGTRLVTDPYGASYEQNFGAVPDNIEADVVTISHYHDDHTGGLSSIGGNPQVIKPEQVGTAYTVGDVNITSYSSDHVANMGENVIYVYQIDGLKIVDMGETDNIASQEAIDAVKDADVILGYAGQYGSVKNKDSFQTLYGLGIKAIIPEHYSNIPTKIFYGEPTMEDILKDVPEDIPITETTEFIVTKDIDKQFVDLATWK